MNKLLVKKLNPLAQIPKRQTEQSAGYDLCACFEQEDTETEIKSGETRIIPTGISLELEQDNLPAALLIYARSSIATKLGLAPANCVGVVDSDYRGEIKIALHNHSQISQTIKHGERIAQLIITPIITPEATEVKELSDTKRGEGGFGSTGIK